MRRPQTKVVYDDNSDEEDDNLSYRSDEDELLNDNPSSDLEEDEALGNDSDYLEELPDDDDDDDGDASYCTESSFRSHSTLGSTPGTFVCKCTHLNQKQVCGTLKCTSFFQLSTETKPHCSKWSLHSETGLCLPCAPLAAVCRSDPRFNRLSCF